MKKVLMAIGGAAYFIAGAAITENVFSIPDFERRCKQQVITRLTKIGYSEEDLGESVDTMFDNSFSRGLIKGCCSCITPITYAHGWIKNKIKETTDKVTNKG